MPIFTQSTRCTLYNAGGELCDGQASHLGGGGVILMNTLSCFMLWKLEMSISPMSHYAQIHFNSFHFLSVDCTPKKSHKQALIARRFIKDWGITALNTVGIGEFELNTLHMRNTGNNLSFHSFIKCSRFIHC